jgi:hypothetical protein
MNTLPSTFPSERKGHGIKVCQSNHPVCSTEQKTGPLSLYLQLDNIREACSRQITTVTPPILERRGSTLVYNLVTPK